MTLQRQLDFARNFGLNIQHISPDKKLYRVPTIDKPRSKNGYYVSFANGIYCGDWMTGRKEFFSTKTGKLTAYDRKQIRQAKEEAEVIKRIIQIKAAALAKEIYCKSQNVNSHPYLIKKGVGPTELMRASFNELYIPLYNLSSMTIENIQRIKPDGTKLFLAGGKISGLGFVINKPELKKLNHNENTIYLAEGIATALTVAEQSNSFTVACMNAGNLLPVGIEIRRQYPTSHIIVAGDNDYKTSLKTGINTGVIKAQECAEAINASVSFPPLTQAQLEAGLTDWNDYIQSIMEVAND